MNHSLIATMALLVALTTEGLAQPADISSLDAQKAENLYAEGQASYERADYQTAIAKWQAAYNLSRENALLFNVAQAKRLSGDCLESLETYRRFVANSQESASEQHKLANDFVHELEMQCPAGKLRGSDVSASPTPRSASIVQSKEPVLDVKIAPETRSTGRAWKVAGIATGSAGVVAIAVGLGLGYRGTAIGDEITSACRTSCDWEALREKDTRGRRFVGFGHVLDAVGVTAVAGGVVLYYFGVRNEGASIAPAPGGRGATVSWGGTW